MSSKIGSMTVVTSSTLPNVLPYYKIRTNPNISLNEWAWLQSLCNESTSDVCTAKAINNYVNYLLTEIR